jgi:4-hydroxy-3-polyprenylbenzoate decarboxylase
VAFHDLASFVRFLEEHGELKRVRVEVDAELEVTEIAVRVVKAKGPALLFENVKGSRFPLLVNPFGTERRVEWALGREPGTVGAEIRALAEDLMPPRPSALWKHLGVFRRALAMRPRRVGSAPVRECSPAPDLESFPVLKCWPKDGGRFMTFPLVFTRHPGNGRGNIGIYRLQVHDKTRTGMHWQIERGGGFHYAEAERRGEALPAAVVLGADPIVMLAGVLPLPEDIDELAFAGYLRGSPTRTTRLASGLEVPADAEIVLEGVVPPFARTVEGPFGDHFGHYSHAAPFPVFEVERVYHRRGAVYPAAVVGLPPQEDKYMGNAAQEMFLPLLKLMRPELSDLWTYYEAGFHNLAVASVRQRYLKEGLKTAFWLLGEGQLSLTKFLVLTDPSVDVRRIDQVLDAIRDHFDPAEDLLLLPGTSQDTLDFTGPAMNLGSKMVLDATSSGKAAAPRRPGGEPPAQLVSAHRNWRDAVLVVRPRGGGLEVLEKLVRDPALSSYRLIVAVGADVPLDDEELLIWGIFTRFDCERDLVPAGMTYRGASARCTGPLGVDATWKEGYPEPLSMDPSVKAKVDRRWNEYGL